ncbi:ribonuclease H [Halobacteriales archaeon QS_3_64_16]|nr:MAG: ribonuclease H [Halobacteriales archaeon QS_3_64_16]
MPVIECDVAAAAERLGAAGVETRAGNTDHERWRAESPEAVAVAYNGKVVVQGSRPHRLASVVRNDDGDDADGAGSSRVYCYFDGASRGNPGPAAIGWVLVADGGIVAEGGERIADTTNNRAEYEALIRVLEVAEEYGFSEVNVRGDSELICKQVRGEYETNQPALRERRVTVRELLAGFEDWTLEHVPREVNDRADARANEVLDNE